MDRRTYLGAAAGAGLTATAGCLGGLLDSRPDGVVLDPPERDKSDWSILGYGDEVPSFSIEDPIAGETISDEQFRGERAYLVTFIYTSCPDGVCPANLQLLTYIQSDAEAEGYADDIAFLPFTFDPQTDTEDVLRQEAQNVGADLDAGNWHFLRPQSHERAVEVIRNRFNVHFQIHLEQDHSNHGDQNGDNESTQNDSSSQTEPSDQNGTGTQNESEGTGENVQETHYDMIHLVNKRGIIERTYYGASTNLDGDQLKTDVRTVVEG